MKPFINLHTNSEYSILESTVHLKRLIDFAKKNQLESLAITDHNVMFGVAEFVVKCKENQIKPIIGLDLDVHDYRLILLAKNKNGYQELMRLSSKKNRGEEIVLNDIYIKDLYIIDHPRFGYYTKYGRFLGLHDYFVGLETDDLSNGVRVFDIRIIYDQEIASLKIVNYIAGKTSDTSNLISYDKALETEKDSMVKQAEIIADNCNVNLVKEEVSMPFTISEGGAPLDLLKIELKKGFAEKIGKVPNIEVYKKRLNYELSIIHELKFENYFLII
jgi:DNA polymerase-3 subunit alpha